MVGWFWDFLVIIAVTIFILGLIAQGLVPLQLGAFAIIALLVLRAVGRGLSGGVGRAVRKTFTIALPIVAVLMFAIAYSGGEMKPMIAILSALGALFITLLGIYIMIRGLFA